jgi:hypothetical protein
LQWTYAILLMQPVEIFCMAATIFSVGLNHGLREGACPPCTNANTLELFMPLPVLKRLSCDGDHRMLDCTRVQLA